jgi:hypothetical protein
MAAAGDINFFHFFTPSLKTLSTIWIKSGFA